MIISANAARILARKTKLVKTQFYIEMTNLTRELGLAVDRGQLDMTYNATAIGNPAGDSGQINSNLLTGIQLDFLAVLEQSGYTVTKSGSHWFISWGDTLEYPPIRGLQGIQGETGEKGETGDSYLPNWETKIASFEGVANGKYLVDTTEGPLMMDLPESPEIGTEIEILDGGNFSVHNFTVNRNGSLINGELENLIFDVSGWVTLVYSGETDGWSIND